MNMCIFKITLKFEHCLRIRFRFYHLHLNPPMSHVIFKYSHIHYDLGLPIYHEREEDISLHLSLYFWQSTNKLL